MMRTIYTLLASVIFIGGCKTDSESPTCTFPAEPQMSDISISVINTFNYKDYLVPKFYDPAHIRVVQPCSPDLPVKIITGSATLTDTNITLTAISFDSLSSYNIWEDCNKLDIYFKNNSEKNSFQFYVDKQRCGNNCCINYYPHVIVDGQTVSPGSGITGNDGKMHILVTVFDPTDTLR